MRFHYTDLQSCQEATGVVLVIDVLRAFSNAAYIFSRGASEIYPVSGVEEALQLGRQIPGALVSGEAGGLPPEGFDFGNSPTQTREQDLTGKPIVQRTGAGTQGIVRSVKAESILAASLVVADATAQFVRRRAPEAVTFVISGQYALGHGDEDLACAEYLELILKDQTPDPAPFIERVFASQDAARHLDPRETGFPYTDLELCTRIDAFDFAMPVKKKNGLHVMQAEKP